VLAVLISLASAASAAKRKPSKSWTDPTKATAEDKDFAIQGEYAGQVAKAKSGVQLVAIGSGRFIFVCLDGGLPGQGANGAARTVCLGQTSEAGTITLKSKRFAKALVRDGAMTVFGADGKAVGELKKVCRTSPTAGAKPPKGAVVLFDGGKADQFARGRTEGGLLCEGTSTVKSFKSFRLHIEFRMPYKPDRFPSNQDRGNSGVYTYNRYETQLLDTFGLHYNHHKIDKWKEAFKAELGTGPQSDRTQWGGCFYKFKTPDVNMCYPPLAWQTYDIDFTAPVFEGKTKTANARITVRHNGVVIHNDVEMVQGGTGAGRGRGEIPAGQIFLQGHGNPVRFRNIWIVEK